jgi:hypothetical protein
MLKVVPTPAADCTSIVPSCASMISSTIYKLQAARCHGDLQIRVAVLHRISHEIRQRLSETSAVPIAGQVALQMAFDLRAWL